MKSDDIKRLRRIAPLWNRAVDSEGRAKRAATGELLIEKWGLIDTARVTVILTEVAPERRTQKLVEAMLAKDGVLIDLDGLDLAHERITVPILLKSAEVRQRYEWSSSQLYRKMDLEGFPRPVKQIGSKAIWSAVEILRWEDEPQRPDETDIKALMRWAADKGLLEAREVNALALGDDAFHREWMRHRDDILLQALKQRAGSKRQFAALCRAVIERLEEAAPTASNFRVQRVFTKRAGTMMAAMLD